MLCRSLLFNNEVFLSFILASIVSLSDDIFFFKITICSGTECIMFLLQMEQLFRRLFPFGRGLCHAYWAPNFWVFYIIFDKGLASLLRKLGYNIQIPSASFTGGLVGSSPSFALLPQVISFTCFHIAHPSCRTWYLLTFA